MKYSVIQVRVTSLIGELMDLKVLDNHNLSNNPPLPFPKTAHFIRNCQIRLIHFLRCHRAPSYSDIIFLSPFEEFQLIFLNFPGSAEVKVG